MPKLSIRNPVHPVAQTLRKAGFIPLPRLWVRAEDMPKIHKIAELHRKEVQRIRHYIADHRPDPRLDKNAAWTAFEKAKRS